MQRYVIHVYIMNKASLLDVHQRNSGFTLVEMLVVITVIGILAGLAIPVIGTVRDKANNATSLSNLRQIGIGMQSLMSEGVPGMNGGPNQFPSYHGNYNGVTAGWIDLLAEHMGIAEIQDGSYVYKKDPKKTIFQNPGKKLKDGVDPSFKFFDPADQGATASYAYNYGLADWSSTWAPPKDKDGNDKPRVNIMSVQKPSQLVVVAESNGDGIYDTHIHAAWGAAHPGSSNRGGANALFADWHVEWKELGDLIAWQAGDTGESGYRTHFDPRQGR